MDTIIAGVSFLLSAFTATYTDVLGIPGMVIKTVFCTIGVMYGVKIMKDVITMSKNKYNHRLYEVSLTKYPEKMKTDDFSVNGKHYYWMTIKDMEEDENVRKKNLEVVDFVKENTNQGEN